MENEVRSCLNDILTATGLLNEFTAGKTLAEYTRNLMLRSATERQLGIIGEAVSKLANLDETTASHITEYQRIIAFRNILIHQYPSVDDRVVWHLLQHKLPILVLEVHALLQE